MFLAPDCDRMMTFGCGLEKRLVARDAVEFGTETETETGKETEKETNKRKREREKQHKTMNRTKIKG